MVTKGAAKKIAPRKKKDEGGSSEPPAEVLPAPVNWAKSTVTKTVLQKFVDTRELPKKEEIFWRAAGDEIRPKP